MTQTPEEKAAAAERARLMLYYRLTPEQVIAIEEWQRAHGLSMVMGHSTMSTGTDHAHDSGLIRGRLDFRLNKAIGLVEAFTSKLSDADYRELGAFNKDQATAAVLQLMSSYFTLMPAVQAVGPVYGLIGKAKRKKVMIYGSADGPIPPVKVIADKMERKALHKELAAAKRVRAARETISDTGICPDCKHAWSRHVERWKGQHQCMARDIDASGNYDGCGCGTVPPKPYGPIGNTD